MFCVVESGMETGASLAAKFHLASRFYKALSHLAYTFCRKKTMLEGHLFELEYDQRCAWRDIYLSVTVIKQLAGGAFI